MEGGETSSALWGMEGSDEQCQASVNRDSVSFYPFVFVNRRVQRCEFPPLSVYLNFTVAPTLIMIEYCGKLISS